MALLPQGFLSKRGEKWRRVRMLDAAILLWHAHRGANMEDVGFEDAQRTLDMLTRELERKVVLVSPSILESCLWSANLLDEKKLFFHPQGKTFDEFLKDVLGYDKYNKMYNFIVNKGD